MDIGELLEISTAERLTAINFREDPNAGGDFTGIVNATWVKLDSGGAGVVSYNDKEYRTQRIGTTSIPAGTSVALSYANGIYYSSW